MLLRDVQQILAVVVLGHRLSELAELLFGDPAALVGNLLDTGYLQSLTLLDDFDEGRGL